MDALKLLREDHDRIKELLKAGAEESDRARTRRPEVFDHLKREIQAHARREEEVLFPVLKTHDETRGLTLEGIEEHRLTEGILSDLESTSVNDERWAAKFKVLKDVVEMHLEEEEHETFRMAHSVVGPDELHALARRMESIRSPEPMMRH